jgi:hypothetical protein
MVFGIAQMFIRGVGNNFFSPGGDPGVATYADGVYLSDQEATAVAFLDLERIEVLVDEVRLERTMADNDIRNLITSTINQYLMLQRRFDAGRLPPGSRRFTLCNQLMPQRSSFQLEPSCFHNA